MSGAVSAADISSSDIRAVPPETVPPVAADQAVLREGRSYLDEGRFGLAEKSFRRAVDSAPFSGLAHDYLGIALLRERRYDEALEQFRIEIRLGQDPGYGWARVADVYTEQGNVREATRAVERAIVFRPDLAQLYLNLGMLYQQGLDLRRSLQALDRCEELDQSNPNVHYLRGNLLYKLGMLSGAEQELQAAISLNPRTGMYHFALAQVLLRHQSSPENRKRARSELELALSLGMAVPAECHYWLGLCYSADEQWEEARQELQQAVDLAPQAWAAFYSLREALLHLGRVDEARKAEIRFQSLRKAEDARMKREFFIQEVRRNPGSVQAHLQLAEYLAANEDFTQSRSELETTRRIAGKDGFSPEIAERTEILAASIARRSRVSR